MLTWFQEVSYAGPSLAKLTQLLPNAVKKIRLKHNDLARLAADRRPKSLQVPASEHGHTRSAGVLAAADQMPGRKQRYVSCPHLSV